MAPCKGVSFCMPQLRWPFKNDSFASVKRHFPTFAKSSIIIWLTAGFPYLNKTNIYLETQLWFMDYMNVNVASGEHFIDAFNRCVATKHCLLNHRHHFSKVCCFVFTILNKWSFFRKFRSIQFKKNNSIYRFDLQVCSSSSIKGNFQTWHIRNVVNRIDHRLSHRRHDER